MNPSLPDALTSLLVPLSNHAFQVRDHVELPQPLTLLSLPTKEESNPNKTFSQPPSGAADRIPLSFGSRIEGKVGATSVHFHPSNPGPVPIIGFHPLLPPCYMLVPETELYASCAFHYTASLPKAVSLSIGSQDQKRHLTPRLLTTGSPPLRHSQSHIYPASFGLNSPIGWSPSHTGIASNGFADSPTKIASEGTPADVFA